MTNKIIWTDNNQAEEGQRIYRSTSSMDTSDMPDPIATTDPDVQEYLDDDSSLEDGVDYYYIISSFVGETEKFSDEFVINSPYETVLASSEFYFKMDEISATTLTDSLGKNDGTLINSPEVVAFGDSGVALSFDGVDQAVSMPNYFESGFSMEEMSVGIWVKTTSGKTMSVMSYDRSNVFRIEIGSHVGIGSGAVGVALAVVGDSIHELSSHALVNDGEWHLIGFTFGGGVFKLIVDGFVEGERDTGSIIGSGEESTDEIRYGFIGCSSEATYQGGDTGDSGQYYSGLIGPSFLMNRNMSVGEFSSLYNQGPEL